ncbi:MAG: ATP phosphoribosyltransferase regulatory subunit [Thermoleophilia bacterium]
MRPVATLPTGARDVLPLEAAELRAAEDALRATLRLYGYREVRTPTLEFAAALERGAGGTLEHVFRLFDEDGRVLVLRPELTIPVARLIATRLTDHPGPLRAWYTGSAFRAPQHGVPAPSEHRQTGAELVGVDGPEADAEVLSLLGAALRAAGLRDWRIGIGDVSLTAAVLDGLGVPAEARERLGATLAARDLVGWNTIAMAQDLPDPQRDLLARLPLLRGGTDVLDRVVAAVPTAAPAADRMRALLAVTDLTTDELLVDLGILRDWPYYTGLVLEAYAHGVGEPIAQGGRYDSLSARFGHFRAAVGWSVELELLHRALAHEAAAPADHVRGVVLCGGLGAHAGLASALRAEGVPVVCLPDGDTRAEAVAAADGWRFVVAPEGGEMVVLDRSSGVRLRTDDPVAMVVAAP